VASSPPPRKEAEMKESGILFRTEMVVAILREDDPKTQTRRIPSSFKPVNLIPDNWFVKKVDGRVGAVYFARRISKSRYPRISKSELEVKLPYCIGDRLWVRETYYSSVTNKSVLGYKADGKIPSSPYNIHHSIFMPKWASRIILEITDVKVERLQDITFYDAVREGMKEGTGPESGYSIDLYKTLWDSINGKKYPWKSNPWLLVIQFKKLSISGGK